MGDSTDILVIGAGVFGLWTALEASRAGLSVILAEREFPGAGASGGVVGALTPHMPGRWRPMKQFQFDALMSLRSTTHQLTAETGLETGYCLSGRLSPLVDQRARDRATDHVIAAEAEWSSGARFEILDSPPDAMTEFLPPDSCEFGVVSDSLSGRVTPRLYIDALATAVAAQGEIRLGWHATEIDGQAGIARFDKGEISAGMIVVAAGWESQDLTGAPSGGGVKGQAAVLALETPEDMPVIQMPQLYIVRQPGGRVAIGSTSETTWDSPGPNHLLDDVIARARTVCPALRNAPVIERWAGVRPRPPGRDPTVGRVPESARLYLASGGYKIGLGIAHLVGKGAIAEITDAETDYPIPTDFRPQLPIAEERPR